MSMPIKFIRYDRSLLVSKQIAGLWKKSNYSPSLPEQKLEKHIRWKYKPSFAKLEIARKGEQVIGSCGAIDLDIYAQKKILKCRWGVDSLTDQGYAQSHPFTFFRVYRKIFKPIFRGDFDLSLNFPSDQIVNFYLKTGWRKMRHALIFAKILNPRVVSTKIKRHTLSSMKITTYKRISIANIKRFPPLINSFLGEVLKKAALVCYRDADFLNWRYADCPTHDYELYLVKLRHKIIAYFILRIEKKENLKIGYIVDILCDLEITHRLDILISQAESIFLKNKIDIIYSLATHEIYQKALTRANFFIKNSINFVYFIKNKPLLRNLIKAEKQWFFTMGDGDFEMED